MGCGCLLACGDPPTLIVDLQFENSLRRHNHLGLIHALVLALAKAGKLDAAKALARESMKTKVAKLKTAR